MPELLDKETKVVNYLNECKDVVIFTKYSKKNKDIRIVMGDIQMGKEEFMELYSKVLNYVGSNSVLTSDALTVASDIFTNIMSI